MRNYQSAGREGFSQPSAYARDIPIRLPPNMPQLQSSSNPYGGLPMEIGSITEFGATRMNPLMRMTSPTNIPFAGRPEDVRRTMMAATNDLNVQARPTGGYYESRDYKLNTNLAPLQESRLQKAVRTCEAVKTDNCSAFDNPEFAKNCMISHVPGKNSQNQEQLGGFVLFEEERKNQLDLVKRGALANMQPMIGQVPNAAEGKSQYVSYDKQSCLATKEAKNCETQGNFDLPNCGKCFDSRGNWYRVAPETKRLGATFTLVGSGSVRVVDDKGNELGAGQLSAQPISVELPENAEGRNFSIIVAGNEVGGYLEGPTISSRSRVDIMYLISADIEGNSAKPRMRGRVMVEDEPMSKIIPHTGKKSMNLVTYVPFTFLDAEEGGARLCPTAPFITTGASAQRLKADPCYDGSAPGKQSLACLQSRFEMAGCSPRGSAYPTADSSEAATKLRIGPDGKPQTLFDITSQISDMSVMAQTGRDMNGQPLDADPQSSLENWNKVSVACTGREIATPCDGMPDNGPVSLACAQYLYENKGAGKPLGETYRSRPIDKFTSARVGNDAVRCTDKGSAFPGSETAPAYKMVMDQGGVMGVKTYFDGIHDRANNNGLSDSERADAVNQCYGIEFAADSRTSEDFTNFKGLEGPMKPTLREGYASASANTTLNPGLGSISYRGTGRNNFMTGAGQVARFVNNDSFRQAGTFSKVNPACGAPGYVSLQPDGTPNMRLTNMNGKVLPFDLSTSENQILSQNNACWREVQGQCENPTAIRLESKSYPGQFMISRGKDIFLDTPNRPGDNEGSCWEPTQRPLKDKTYTPETMPASMDSMEVRRSWNFHDDNRTYGDNPSYETNPTGTNTWEECAQRALNFVDRRGFAANGFVWAPERYMPGQNCRTKIGGYFQNFKDPNWAPLVSGQIKDQ